MKTQMKSSLKWLAILLVTTSVGLAETSVSTAVRSGSIPDRGYDQAAGERQGVPGTINYVEGQVMLNGEPLPATRSLSPTRQSKLRPAMLRCC